jgi:hypothetical protein
MTASLRLLGYDAAVMSPHQQATVRLTLHWQILAPVGADYKVSARLLDGEGNQIAQVDNVPVHNTYPTSHWKADETIADVYDLTVPPGTPSGPYHLLVILYDRIAWLKWDGQNWGQPSCKVQGRRTSASTKIKRPLVRAKSY